MSINKCDFDCTYCKTPCYKALQTTSIEKIRQQAKRDQEKQKQTEK